MGLVSASNLLIHPTLHSSQTHLHVTYFWSTIITSGRSATLHVAGRVRSAALQRLDVIDHIAERMIVTTLPQRCHDRHSPRIKTRARTRRRLLGDSSFGN